MYDKECVCVRETENMGVRESVCDREWMCV